MLQLIPQLRILLCCEPVDFRCGIDRLAAMCRNVLGQEPYSGAVFVFRNRRGTAVKILAYDGLGYYLVLRRFSQGRLRWWPDNTDEKLTKIAAQHLQGILYQGNPVTAQLAQDWRSLSS